MEVKEEDNVRKWEELIPDALGLIFKKLPLQDILTVIPSVCKSWEKAVVGPYCWEDIDILNWNTESQPDQVNRMLRLLLPRSCGSLQSLRVSGVESHEAFEVIAQFAGSLESLTLRRSKMIDSTVEKLASKFTSLKYLDLCYCYEISTRSILHILSCCPELEYLDVGWCWMVHLDPVFLQEKHPKLNFVNPIAGYVQSFWNPVIDDDDDH